MSMIVLTCGYRALHEQYIYGDFSVTCIEMETLSPAEGKAKNNLKQHKKYKNM